MDKQTLSNYGWLVIVTLILAVMLALATPFGTYVGDAVVSVANGFVGASNEAIDEDNIAVNEDKWEEKMRWVTIGDLNEDGKILASDSTVILGIINGNISDVKAWQLTAADVNKDGIVSQEDATIIMEYFNLKNPTGHYIGEKTPVNFNIQIQK